MRKILLFFYLLSVSLYLTGCFKIYTPEDLIETPVLNKSKKEMKEAVEKFRPPNSVPYSITLAKEKKTASMIIKDLDSDTNAEVISFYKNKSDEKIGMFIIKNVDSHWLKVSDMEFNTYEIENLSMIDLNNDGKKEVIVESYEIENKLNPRKCSILYFSEKHIEKLKETSYVVMEISDIDFDGVQEIFTIKRDLKNSQYIMDISYFDKNKIKFHKSRVLKNIRNPYNIEIGYIYEDQMAIFVDYMGINNYENTQISLIDEDIQKLVDSRDLVNFDTSSYHFNLQSKDVDNDGIIEVGYKFKAPNYSVPVIDDKEVGLVNGYFKINKDYKLELVKEVYEEYAYTFNIPNSFKGKYTINISKDGFETNVNFINNLGKEYPLIKLSYIKRYEWQKNNALRNDMQVITETQDNIIAGKILDYSDTLDGQDKIDYMNMRSDALILSNIIKEKIY